MKEILYALITALITATGSVLASIWKDSKNKEKILSQIDHSASSLDSGHTLIKENINTVDQKINDIQRFVHEENGRRMQSLQEHVSPQILSDQILALGELNQQLLRRNNALQEETTRLQEEKDHLFRQYQEIVAENDLLRNELGMTVDDRER